MFRCEGGHHSKPGEKPVRVVTEKRDKEYNNDRGTRSRGWEIVVESLFCADHAVEYGWKEPLAL